MTAVLVQGHVSSGFEPVADAFADNFRHRGDTAASCVVYAQGAPVVDIWAGRTARGAWTRGARTGVFSVSKGVTTVCLLMAAERGLVDLDAPVAKYWPEFAENGKEATTVRHLLAHRAGLVAPEADLGTFGSTGDFYPMANEAGDAQDAVAWLRTQPWFDGRLATSGGSYVGWTQWALLMDPPPNCAPA
jgi:CubicO group peptidase (beta-lactamase class C family)